MRPQLHRVCSEFVRHRRWQQGSASEEKQICFSLPAQRSAQFAFDLLYDSGYEVACARQQHHSRGFELI
jgi:hypothetical protein